MKIIKLTIAIAALFAATLTTQAQTLTSNNVVSAIPPVTSSASFTDGLKEMETAITTGTNWSAVASGGHSLKGNNWLGALDVAYAFNDNVGIVVGYDALKGSGEHLFNSVKGGVTLKTDIYPLTWTGNATLSSIKGAPFVADLISTSQNGSEVGNIVCTGISFSVYSFSKYDIGGGVEYEDRSGQGVFDGGYLMAFLKFSRDF